MKKLFCVCSALLIALVLTGCGGGGSSSSSTNPGSGGNTNTAANAVQVEVSSGGGANLPMVSVTLCQPGTSNCKTINNILVDSGSSGLVLNAAASSVSSSLSSLNLPAETLTADGHQIGACTVYGGGVAWGPMVTADVKMAGELAQSVPVELAASSTFPAAPSACTTNGAVFSSTNSMGVNGILGIAGDYGYVPAEGGYFDCTSTSCSNTQASPQNAQVLTGVIGKFSSDNNGAILSFPSIASNGAASATGTLTFGLNTQTNNSTAGVPMVDGLSNASMTTTYNGTTNMPAILDSGSSVDYLGSAPISTCTVSGYSDTWFCPASVTTQTALYQYQHGGSPLGSPLNVTFAIGNANTLLTGPGSANNWALPNLAMQMDLFATQYLDLGMSFLYGHALYMGYSATTPTIGLTTD